MSDTAASAVHSSPDCLIQLSDPPMDSFTFTVGKLDAGMAILIGERAHLIEFPSLLLPPGVTSGSIVNIAVHRNHAEENRQRSEFWHLQDSILETFGSRTPKAPSLQLRNTTQTSVTLEWPPLELATSKLRSLDIYRNGQRLATIPTPTQNTSTKLSGLALDTEYTFQLILRTTAGTFPSNVIKLKTHTMVDTSGISVCFGNVEDKALLENAKLALEEMGAKWSDKVQIDTTHFVCTSPAATPLGAGAVGNTSGAPGVEYQKALQASIPIVQPYWILACHQEHKMVPISSFYLGVTPPTGIQTAPFVRSSKSGTASTSSLTKTRTSASPSTSSNNVTATPFVNQSSGSVKSPEARGRPIAEESEEVYPTPPVQSSTSGAPRISTSGSPAQIAVQSADEGSDPTSPTTPGGTTSAMRAGKPSKRRTGTMTKDFRFPPSSPPPPLPSIGGGAMSPTTGQSAHKVSISDDAVDSPSPNVAASTSKVEIPPPVPISKERVPSISSQLNDGDDDVGDTVEVDLS